MIVRFHSGGREEYETTRGALRTLLGLGLTCCYCGVRIREGEAAVHESGSISYGKRQGRWVPTVRLSRRLHANRATCHRLMGWDCGAHRHPAATATDGDA